jgi:DNA polymerase-3 subunit beta
MVESARSIGELARASGLSVSALRFYDAAGVLRPAQVNPLSGYRWYTADQLSQAKLIAQLRNANMPLADICDVLAARHDTGNAIRLLDAHRARLEHALTNARQSLDTARDLLTQQEKPMTQLTVLGTDLNAALSAVRFAASHDRELPALNGVLFHYDGGTLRLVATDRYRLAVATVAARDQLGPAIQLIAPLSLLDDLALAADDDIRVELNDASITIGPAHADAINAPFPDYQNILRTTPARHISITTADVLQRITTGATRTMADGPNNAPHEVTVVLLTDQTIDVLDHHHPDAIGFNRAFLLQALEATDADQLVLAIDGPTGPLAIHDPERPDHINLLMPTLLT